MVRNKLFIYIPSFLLVATVLVATPLHMSHAESIGSVLENLIESNTSDTSNISDITENKNTNKGMNTEKNTSKQATTTSTATRDISTTTTESTVHVSKPDSELQKVLNEIIVPAEVRTPRSTTTSPSPKPSPITLPAKSTSTKATTTPSKNATSTVAGIVSAPNNSGQTSSYNYYKPLDNLDPATTYGFSALAMIIGITGAAFVVRDTVGARTLTTNTFTPRGALSNPLLDR